MTALLRYRELEDEIERVRTEKENAIEAQEFEKSRIAPRQGTEADAEEEGARGETGARRSPRSSLRSNGRRLQTSSRCGRGSPSSS